MEQDYLDILVLQKKIYQQLVEIEDLTKQMAEAISRNDQDSLRMLLAMRQDPILVAEECKRGIKRRLRVVQPQHYERISSLLRGGEAQNADEKLLAQQIGQNRRLLDQITIVDKHLNQKMAGEQSFYKK